MYIEERGVFEEELCYTKSLILPLIYINPKRFDVEQAWLNLELTRIAIKMPYKYAHSFISRHDYLQPTVVKKKNNFCIIECELAGMNKDVMIEIEKVAQSKFSELNAYARRMIIINRGEVPNEFNRVRFDDFTVLLHKGHPVARDWFKNERLINHGGYDESDVADYDLDEMEYLQLFTKEEYYDNRKELI